MIDFLKADAHIHLFEGGYQEGSLTSRPGVEVDELHCYQSLMNDHHIETALVGGFEGDVFSARRTEFVLSNFLRVVDFRSIFLPSLPTASFN